MTVSRRYKQNPHTKHKSQTDFFSALTGNALTTVFAGFAATVTSLPNISLLPAFVAGFFLVLIMTRPGITNLPTCFTCLPANSARASTILAQSDFFSSEAVARASAIPVFDRAVPADLGFAFIAFMAVIDFIAVMNRRKSKNFALKQTLIDAWARTD